MGGVLGFALTKVMMRTGLFGKTFTPQENAAIQTLSVAVYSLSYPCFGFTNGWLALSKECYDYLGAGFEGNNLDDIVDVNWWRSVVWSGSLFSFGFFIAYPLRNYYVIKKRLMFPSGTATAYVISALHASKESARKGLAILGKFFSLAFVVNMLTWEFEGLAAFPIFGIEASKYGWALDWDLGSFGIGMLLSLQINASMLFGALLMYAVLQPIVSNHFDGTGKDDWFDSNTVPSPYLGLKAYPLFAGLAVMIVQGIWSVVEILVTVVIAYVRKEEVDEEVDEETRQRDEIFSEKGFPVWASVLGYCVTGAVTCIVHYFMLGTKWYQTLVALVIVPLIACSNIEGMGRTDWDVASSYGKLMMFPIGWWNQGGSIKPALAVCHTTISGCSSSAALMQDFKTGYLLGASPAIMFYSQIIGSVLGCLICPGLFVLLRSAWTIPTDDPNAFITGLYAPIFRTLAIVATGSGFGALPKNCLYICLGFVVLAILLNITILLCQKFCPKVVTYIPEPSAMSIGMIVGASVPFEFFTGGLITWFWSRHRPQQCEELRAYIASGFIAGSGFAVVLQVIVSLCGLQPNIAVGFLTSRTTESYMGAKEWVMAAIAILCTVGAILLGAFCWFRVGDPPAEAAEQARLLDDSRFLDNEDVVATPRSLSTSSEGYLEEEQV
jgi:OPT family oligopeptide transporter